MPRFSHRVFWSDEDEGFIAESPEFPTLSAFGETPEEAVAELGVVLEDAVALHQSEGWPVPTPRVAHEYSGQLRLRLPKSLHRELSLRAEEEHVSLNQLLVTYVAQAAGQQSAVSDLSHAYQLVASQLLTYFAEGLSAVFQPLAESTGESTYAEYSDPLLQELYAGSTQSATAIRRLRAAG